MRKLLLVLPLIAFFVAVQKVDAVEPYRKLCVGIEGKFTANSTWRGGPIQVGCSGDSGAAVNNDPNRRCDGEIQTVRPGQSYRLTRCSCFGSNKGCLVVGKVLKKGPLTKGKRLVSVVTTIESQGSFKQGKCTLSNTKNICGANGKHIKGNVIISCRPDATPTPTRIPTPTPTPVTPSPSPSICPGPTRVVDVKVTCPDCFSQNDLDEAGKEEDQ